MNNEQHALIQKLRRIRKVRKGNPDNVLLSSTYFTECHMDAFEKQLDPLEGLSMGSVPVFLR